MLNGKEMHVTKKHIHLIAAARPNFMKIAPLYHALKKYAPWSVPMLVHTGQHYDLNMSDVFFKDLGLPDPDIHLGVGSGSHAQQTAQVMIEYEKVLEKKRPDLVIVVGDVNSTVAVSLTSVKMGIPVAHLEAGLRSFDRTMPEEINRLLTDAIADLLWTPSPDGDQNLVREGVNTEKIVRVGNIMIDSLEMLRPRIQGEKTAQTLELKPGYYVPVTLHRPANVDPPESLKSLCQQLLRISQKWELVFPIHPRTRKNLDTYRLLSLLEESPRIRLLEPLNYIRFMSLIFECAFVITDSGGIQEETSYLGIPCITLRPNTERPITISQGTNQLCTVSELESKVAEITNQRSDKPPRIELWDGHTAERVVDSIGRFLAVS